MINDLKILLNSLLKFGNNQESYLVNLLIKLAGYDDEWKDKIQGHARRNKKPFDAWFEGKNRVYVPFKAEKMLNSEIDYDVDKALKEEGYTITDYVAGYCEKNNRTFKIGKIIQKLKEDGIKILKEYKSATRIDNQTEYEKFLREVDLNIFSLEEYWKNINSLFLNSPIRSNKQHLNQLEIVYSQDPHDLAKMSYERGWTSCMRLGKGEQHEEVFCEVEEGGFIAYLINSKDKEIENPLARIHIRRFSNDAGINLAKPEETVYGNTVNGFEEAVSAWVAQKNKQTISNPTPGYYERKGGKWSDTFDDHLIITPEKKEELIEWLNEEIPNTKKSTWIFTDNNYTELEENGYFQSFPDLRDESCAERTFETKIEANNYKNNAQGMFADYDTEDYWIKLISGIDESDFRYMDEEEVQDANERINSAKQNRFIIMENKQDHSKALKNKAVDILIEKYMDNLGYEVAESMVNYLSKPEVVVGRADYLANSRETKKTNDLIAIFLEYPDLLTPELFATYKKDRQKEILLRIRGVFPKKIKELSSEIKNHIIDSLDIKDIDPKEQSFKVADKIIYALQKIKDVEMDADIYNALSDFYFSNINKIPQLNSANDSSKKDLIYSFNVMLTPERLGHYAPTFAMEYYNSIERNKFSTDPNTTYSVLGWCSYLRAMGKDAGIFINQINELMKNFSIDVESIEPDMNDRFNPEHFKMKKNEEKGKRFHALDYIFSSIHGRKTIEES